MLANLRKNLFSKIVLEIVEEVVKMSIFQGLRKILKIVGAENRILSICKTAFLKPAAPTLTGPLKSLFLRILFLKDSKLRMYPQSGIVKAF